MKWLMPRQRRYSATEVHLDAVWLACLIWVFGAVTAFTLAFGLAGCSDQNSGQVATGAYGTEFAEALAETESEIVASVLKDGEVTRAEYQEVMDGFAGCLRDAGLHPSLQDQPDGSIGVVMAGDEPESRDIEDACRDKWVGDIDALYIGTSTNPEKLEWYDLLAACLVHKKLVPAGFSGDDMRAFEESAGQVSEQADGTKEITMDSSNGPLTLPGRVDYYDSRTVECLVNPGKAMAGKD